MQVLDESVRASDHALEGRALGRARLQSRSASANLLGPRPPTTRNVMNFRRTFLALGLVSSLGLAFAFAAPRASLPTVAAAPETFAIDTVHSTILFRIQHMGVSWSYGRFNDFSGTVVVDKEKPANSKVEITIKTESIDTGNEMRDGHLRSADFFDAKQFGTATFTSKSVKPAGDKKATIAGDLSLHGVTKPVTLEAEETGRADSDKGTVAGYHGTFTIRRSDFGMNYGPGALGDEVFVTVSLEVKKQ
jgi:polyisoprenoid-binding protein YceI